ncbi:CLK4-associating serine arginine rich isoform B [Micractinium conductrix]|uniref:CLK4-associating serine arginine rich isoform B n=1 Tax=Micractinium conductrix TaxID=554055 RepID=A0A2P6V9Y3_9CHLO|nr:CLK4-associating serine arginine rich isoform B [Micractinium conductrix]|eukprot:PSC70871.1 CLK4-associating serine arginine rich isoform B [Micractinium conductrix]
MEEAQTDAPIHALRLDGAACRLLRNDAQSYAQRRADGQAAEGLVPWGAKPDVLIDRYDVRSLLDMYIEPDPSALRHRQRSTREVELEEQLQFEAFRDLIRLTCLGLSERQGIRHAEQENIAIRAQARSAAVAELEASKGPKPLPPQNTAFATAGTGQFAAVGFSYGGGGEEEGSDEEDEEEGYDSDDDAPATAEDQDMDAAALKNFRIEDFSSMLRWAMKEEADAASAAASRRRARRRWGRKKARLRSARLAGQGLDPALFTKPPPGQRQQQATDLSWIPEAKKPEDLAAMYVGERGSPRYGGRARSRSGSPGGRAPQPEFITSFAGGGCGGGCGGGGVAGGGARRQQPGVAQAPRDALPGAKDPASEGPQLLPAAAFKLHGVRPEERRDRYSGAASGRDYSKAKVVAAAAPAPKPAVDKSRETPAERLKRLMAAQLNKKIQKDSLQASQKQQVQEEEKRARDLNMTVALAETERRQRRRSRSRSRSADRQRRRSRSADRHRWRGSGSRSRSRSRDARDRERRSSRRSPSPPRHYSSSGRR